MDAWFESDDSVAAAAYLRAGGRVSDVPLTSAHARLIDLLTLPAPIEADIRAACREPMFPQRLDTLPPLTVKREGRLVALRDALDAYEFAWVDDATLELMVDRLREACDL
jgi:hypothetical protein